mmetsp:Transcript_21899/g.29308  ORF Transcript_21899/g.29308 Transcript_21899/m.29308 type:complete len:101 (+) Transcript_21899:140-442(+)
MLRVVCNRCENADADVPVVGDQDDEEQRLFKMCNLYSGSVGDADVGQTEDHMVFEDRVGRAMKRCGAGKCQQLYNLTHEELTPTYTQNKVIESMQIDFDC